MPEAHRLRKAAEVLGDDGAEILRRYGYVEAASALEKQLETERLRSSKPFWWNENVLRYRGRQLDPEETKAVLEFIDEFRDRPRTSN